ncbi:MAG: FkbM family methyltransferase [Proteobacteria bacterium]|nr:FkbM family methyltransferase [Pseudomonadota bacterium]
MNAARMQNRIEYYKSALGALRNYGGDAELARGLARIVLRKPSDALRMLRWKLASKFAHLDRVILKFPNFDLLVSAKDEGIAAELAIDRMHEPLGTKVLLSILKDDMTLVELGANIGYYTMQEAKHRKLKKIVAIEPNPTSFEFLSENVRLNQCDNIELHNVGISDIDGNLPFYISKHSNICSITPRESYASIIDVPVTRLDTLLAKQKIKKVDLIRMDIEGHEIQALKGMLKTLERDKPWICMEYHAPMISAEDRNDFVTTLESLGYALKCFTFRWSDYPIFGHTLVNRDTVLKVGNLRQVLEDIPKQVLLLFLAPDSEPFELPKL